MEILEPAFHFALLYYGKKPDSLQKITFYSLLAQKDEKTDCITVE
jgi:hypothetical protein